MSPTVASENALKILRVFPEEFKWYLIPLFAIVVYIYAVEIEKRNWSRILAGLAFFGMDLFNETWNALILHFTDHSAFWTCAGETGFLIFVGLNIEISLMFAMAGIGFTKMLPEDKTMKFDLKFIKIPNRWVFAVGNSVFCVFVEVILNQAGALVWEYPFWEATLLGVIPIIIFGYLHFMVVSFWVYDMEKMRNKILVVASILIFDSLAIGLFALVLGWI
ncbi:MAG: hypothetical protein ACFFFH_02665 [Candidatus Thorarchaeota archaeon]